MLTIHVDEELARFDKLWVGFSGGLDSTVLLHYLANQPLLAGKISAIHVHHGLSLNADAWQQHCQHVCHKLNIPLRLHRIQLNARANLEEAARTARYQVFAAVLQAQECLLLAHHADDQAETLLLQLFRGAGIDGLAAMPKYKPFAAGHLLRPFLEHSRLALEAYATLHQLKWVDDESNQDSAFSRNYLRHHIVPLLQKKWPGVSENLVACAHHCQQAQSNLQALAALDYTKLAAQGSQLPLAPLHRQSQDRVANVVRCWIKNNHVTMPSTRTFNRIIHEVIASKVDAKPSVQWADVVIKRYRQTLYLLKNHTLTQFDPMDWSHFPTPLQTATTRLQAVVAERGVYVPLNALVSVRYRQGGERLRWHGQTKTLKKLLQQWDIPPWLRDRIPLIYIDDKLAVVVGYAVSDEDAVCVADSGIDPQRIFTIVHRP